MVHVILFGGAFDPFHIGHEAVVDTLAKSFPDSIIKLTPTGAPPHKKGPTLPQNIRVAALKKVCAKIKQCELELFEVGRDEPSYTVDTLRYLRGAYPGAKLSLVVGADQFFSLHTWKKPDELLGEADLLVFPRGENIDKSAALDYARGTLEVAALKNIQFIEMTPVDVSSTKAREEMARGGGISGCVPDYLLSTYGEVQ